MIRVHFERDKALTELLSGPAGAILGLLFMLATEEKRGGEKVEKR